MSDSFPPNQYTPTSEYPAKSNHNGLIIAGIAAGVGGLFFLGCCGLGGVMLLAFSMITEEVKVQVRDHSVIQEHIGEIESFSVMYGASLASGDDDTFMYEIQGTRGSGELTVRSVTDGNGNEIVTSASLRTSQGTTHALEFE